MPPISKPIFSDSIFPESSEIDPLDSNPVDAGTPANTDEGPLLDITIDELLVDPDAIPSPPMLVMQVIRLADDPDVSIPKLSKLVEQDAPLAAKFVRMANSSLFSPSREITSVQRALVVVGLRSVRILALSTSMKSLLPPTAGGLECEEARRRSLVNAIASKLFLERLDKDTAEQAFLAGLLGHIGMLVIAAEAPEVYEALIEEDGEWPSPSRQMRVLGFTADELTSRLTTKWGLPDSISDGIRCRSGIEILDSGAEASTILMLRGLEAGCVAEEVLCGKNSGEALRELSELAHESFGMDLDAVSRVLLDIEPVLEETAGLLSFDLPPGNSHAELLAEAMGKMQNISLDAVSAFSRETQAVEELSQRNRALETENRQDDLTGLLNRRGFDAVLSGEIDKRLQEPQEDALGLLVFDIDFFKKVNDTYGHQVGDEVLREVGHAFRRVSRKSEFVARQGGEEFALILPHTNLEEMKQAAERLRNEVAEIMLRADGEIVSLTISAGGAAVNQVGEDGVIQRLYERADQLLYEAKRNGRNRSVIDDSLI